MLCVKHTGGQEPTNQLPSYLPRHLRDMLRFRRPWYLPSSLPLTHRVSCSSDVTVGHSPIAMAALATPEEVLAPLLERVYEEHSDFLGYVLLPEELAMLRALAAKEASKA